MWEEEYVPPEHGEIFHKGDNGIRAPTIDEKAHDTDPKRICTYAARGSVNVCHFFVNLYVDQSAGLKR